MTPDVHSLFQDVIYNKSIPVLRQLLDNMDFALKCAETEKVLFALGGIILGFGLANIVSAAFGQCA
jgi:hypothetical protein